MGIATRVTRLPMRVGQVGRILDREGIGGLRDRATRVAARRLRGGHVLPVFTDDLVADPVPEETVLGTGDPLTVHWAMTPPSPGSGGHTTIFRIMRHLEAAGVRCRILLYDRYLGDMAHHARRLRAAFPDVRAEVVDARGPLDPAHAIFATSWPTAYPVVRTPGQGRRFYFVQDFEPWFHAAGSEAALAEATYRMGMHGVTVGAWLADVLWRDHGMPCDSLDFGCDPEVYRLDATGPRSGITFYARPSAPRRAFELGVLALERFARRCPEVPIHLFGETVSGLGFPYTNHGLCTPAQLNRLYNDTVAGLTLSMSNVSLTPLELLASGCVPVVNDAEHNRRVLANPYVHYAEASPQGLSAALQQVVVEAETPSRAATLAASVRGRSWDAAGDAVLAILHREFRTERGTTG